MARIHLVLGPVGSGKSTLSHQLRSKHRAVHLNLDAWMGTLYAGDPRPEDRMSWYLERTERCGDLIWELAGQLLEAETDVVLELGLIRRADRARFYERVDDAGHELVVYVLDAPRDVRRERVVRRNTERGETWSMDVPPEIFELASDLWEPPNAEECEQRGVLFL